MTYQEAQSNVVAGISVILAAHRARMESERFRPRHTGDEMDDEIKQNRERVEVMKRLRDEFEAEMAKPI